MIENFRDIVDLWGGPVAMCDDLYRHAGVKIKRPAVSMWGVNSSIPAWYWVPIVKRARERRFRGVTYERLAILAYEATQ